jgi:serine/threonine protein kinase
MVLSAGYMSPEQVRGGDVDARSDIFSVSTVFSEMLTGRALHARDLGRDDDRHPEGGSTGADRRVAGARAHRGAVPETRETRFQSARDRRSA